MTQQSILSLYHQKDKVLWDELQLHLNLVARRHQEYTWSTTQIQEYKQSSETLGAHLIVLGISVHFLNELYCGPSGLYAALLALSKQWRWQWDSRIIAVRMRNTNWDSEKEAFRCRSVLPHLHPWIAGNPQWRNDACADVALLIEQAIGEHNQARLLETQGEEVR